MKGNNSTRRVKRRNSYVRPMEMTRDLKKDEEKDDNGPLELKVPLTSLNEPLDSFKPLLCDDHDIKA